MSTYSEFINKPISEKITLAWIEPSQELTLWTLDSGTTYIRSVDYYVIDVREGSTSLTEAASSSLSAGEWFFDPATYELYVRLTDDTNPNGKMSGTFRLFFADHEIALPHDLTLTGNDVLYQSFLKRVSKFTQRVDRDQIGIALEGTGSIDFHNESGFFDDKFDQLFWENKTVKIFSYSRELDDVTESQQIFEGLITGKSYSNTNVKFNVKDFINKLQELVNLPLFSSSDGDLDDSTIGKPKRRLYGKNDGVQCIPIDETLTGYSLTGTISAVAGGTTVTGTGTSFTSECLQNDKLIIGTQELTIRSITSDTSLEVSDEINVAFNSVSAINSPNRPYSGKNRNWHICGHKLREPSTTVVTGSQRNRFTVADITDFEVDDVIVVNGERNFIKRINGTEITTLTNLDTTPSASDPVTRAPVSRAFYNGNELVVERDYTVTNNSSDCVLNITTDAEFNLARVRSLGEVTFTNSDRTVTAGAGVNFEALLQPGDFLRSSDLTHQVWYRVSSITDEDNLELDTAYAAATLTDDAVFKSPEYIDSSAKISVNCSGKEDGSGNWLKTASDAIKDLVVNDAGISNIDTTSFSLADEIAFYKLSLAIPARPLATSPKIRDEINRINKSVFGSLVTLTDFSIALKILDPEKPSDLEEIKDDDILNFSVTSRMDISNKIVGRYRHFDLSRFTGDDGSKVYEFENEFVDKNIGINKIFEVDIFVFDDEWAQILTQRYALARSLSQSTVKLRSNLKFALSTLGDKISLNLDRLYKRFGQGDRRKIGVISRVSNDGRSMDIEIQDLGNIFNRVPNIAPNSVNDFSSALNSELIRYGYIVDNTTETPDNSVETQKGQNIVG